VSAEPVPPQDLDAVIWREHECWLAGRLRRWAERERWTDADWTAVRLAAERGWDGRSYFVYTVERAVRERQHERIEQYLAFEREHGIEWLRGVLRGTA
jgi:hypothetical protein